MRVRCTELSFKNLHPLTQQISGYAANGQLAAILIGDEFDVLAIGYDDGSIWYYLGGDFPSPKPANLFEIVGSAIPDGWVISSNNVNQKFDLVMCPKLFLLPDFDTFYWRLCEGDPIAESLLRQYRKNQGWSQ